jgi:hypothetical protein
MSGVASAPRGEPALVQGVYYLLIGLWPWVHLSSFLWVTGEKTDLWLVQTVGLLVIVIGATMCVAAYGRETSRAVLCLALGSAAALAFVDVFFVIQGRISPVYLLDAVLEASLVALWVHSMWLQRVTPAAPGQAPRPAA